MTDPEGDDLARRKRALLQRLDAVGWGAFLIWLGIAFLANIGWGAGLIGVGLIILAGQAARAALKLPVEWFWLVFGTVLLIWGALEILQLRLGAVFLPGDLFSILLIVAGVALVFAGLHRKSQQ